MKSKLKLKGIIDIPISHVKVNGRFRKDLGDIKALSEFIMAAEGQLIQPIVIDENAELIAGGRRLEACKLLGWKSIPARVLNMENVLLGEFYENSGRKELTMSEAHAMLEAVQELRIGHRTKRGANCTPFQLQMKGKKSTTIAAKATGRSERQLSKEKFIIEAAQAQPVLFASYVKGIDSGKLSVDNVYKEIDNELWKQKQLQDNEIGKNNFQKLFPQDRIRLIHGDCRIKALEEIQAESCQLVFTDPLYAEKYLPFFEDLGNISAQILGPGGSLVTYYNQHLLPKVLNNITSGSNGELHFWDQLFIELDTTFSPEFNTQIEHKIKPLLWFVKGSRPINPSFPRSRKEGKKRLIPDLIKSIKPDKRFHEFQQSPVEAEFIMKYLTKPNDRVVDPFLGAGTTAVASWNMKRRFIGFDIDNNAIEKAKANLRINTKKLI